MKKIAFLSTVLFACFCLKAQTITNVYDYPIKPGTKEWKNLKTQEARFASLEIPDTIIKNMTTEALIKTCMKYPVWTSIFYANRIPLAVQNLIKLFNGLNELASRKDAGLELLNFYSSLSVVDINYIDEINKSAKTFQFSFIEFLIGDARMLATFSPIQKLALRKEVIAKYSQKEKLMSEYGMINLKSGAYLLGILIMDENKQDLLGKSTSDMKYFLYNGIIASPELLKSIYTISKTL